MKKVNKSIPEGYRENALDHLVRKADISERELLHDQVVTDLVTQGIAQHEALRAFKAKAITDLISVAGQKWPIDLGGEKGKAAYLLKFGVTYETGLNDKTLTPVFIAMAAGKIQLPALHTGTEFLDCLVDDIKSDGVDVSSDCVGVSVIERRANKLNAGRK